MPVWDKYGFSKNDPDYWLKTTRAILDDGAFTREDKYEHLAAFIKSYYAERDDKTAREQARKGPSNLDPNNPKIREAEEYSESIQNPKFVKGKKP